MATESPIGGGTASAGQSAVATESPGGHVVDPPALATSGPEAVAPPVPAAGPQAKIVHETSRRTYRVRWGSQSKGFRYKDENSREEALDSAKAFMETL